MTDFAQVAVDQLDEVLRPYALREDRATNNYTLRTRIVAAIERLAPPNSAYLRDANAVLDGERNPVTVVHRLAAIADGLRADYKVGYLKNIAELVHADVFDDFLDMGTALLDSGYKDPAAVIVGSVLEEHLRKLAAKENVATANAEGKARRAEALNEDLGKGTYNKLDQKNVTAWLALRNEAAHGEYDEYDHRQVGLLIDAVREFLARHPA